MSEPVRSAGPAGRRARWLAVLCLSLGVGLIATAESRPAPPGAIQLLEIEGVINPLTARYLSRELRGASDAELIIIRLNTPGGLESSMREMSQAILGSPVPVVVYVGPAGARAASAGLFLTISAHVAAMAPGTNIGAAHPVGVGGRAGDEVMAEKVTSDAAALGRAIAQSRGRNGAWVDRAVRQSVAITAEEALEEDVIDLVASDLEALLRQLDGRKVTTAAGEVTLRTAGAPLRRSQMTLPDRILQAITDPNIAYLLFTLGLIGLAAELYSPGLLFPGITGAISLLLALVAFGSLPLNWAGLVLMVLAVVLFGAELHSPGVGVLGVGAVAAFVLGSLMLYTPTPAMPDVRVSPWLIGVIAPALAGFLLVLGRAVVQSRRAIITTGIQALTGSRAVATSELAPNGTVVLNGEAWSARAVDGPIHPGEAVRVTGVAGVTLQVARHPPGAEPRG